MEANRNPRPPQTKVRVPVQEFAAKFQTKREVYSFLTVDCKAYEPPQGTVTIWHLRDQAAGKKRWIKGDDIKHLVVP
jgi:hypothetical protein